MAEKVTYHQEGGKDREFTILSKREDGTVDIGPAGGPPIVTRCQVVEEPAFGKCTIKAEKSTAPEAESSQEDQSGEDEKSTKKNSKR